MRKRVHEIYALAALILAMAVSVCGCGSAAAETMGEAVSGGGTEAVLAAGTSAAGVASFDAARAAEYALAAEQTAMQEKESGEVSLRVWAGEEDGEFLSVVADNFIKEHAQEANITIEIEPMVEGECRSNLLGDVLNGPDVYTTTDGDIRAIAAGGAASPVVHQEEVAEANLEASVEAMTVGGKLYGYPITADNGYFLYYNKAYLSETDVRSLDTILAVAAKNDKKFYMNWASGWYLYSFYGQTGLQVGLNEDGVTNFCDWNSTSNSITGLDVANALLEIAASPAFESSEDWVAGMASGDVIACVSGVWDEAAIKEILGSDYGAAMLPAYTCAGQQIQMSCYFGYKMIGVNPYSEHLAWAHELAEYISNEDNQKLRFEMRGQGPSNLNAAQSPEVQASAAIQAVLKQSEYSELQRLGGNFWDPATELGNTLASGNVQDMDLQAYLDTIVGQITASTVQ